VGLFNGDLNREQGVAKQPHNVIGTTQLTVCTQLRKYAVFARTNILKYLYMFTVVVLGWNAVLRKAKDPVYLHDLLVEEA
jgi:hypothetical protein